MQTEVKTVTDVNGESKIVFFNAILKSKLFTKVEFLKKALISASCKGHQSIPDVLAVKQLCFS